jgi:hypothetical protein
LLTPILQIDAASAWRRRQMRREYAELLARQTPEVRASLEVPSEDEVEEVIQKVAKEPPSTEVQPSKNPKRRSKLQKAVDPSYGDGKKKKKKKPAYRRDD